MLEWSFLAGFRETSYGGGNRVAIERWLGEQGRCLDDYGGDASGSSIELRYT